MKSSKEATGASQIDVRARSQGTAASVEVRTKRRSMITDIHRPTVGKLWPDRRTGLSLDGGRIQDDSGIDGRDELDQALILQASDPFGVDLSGTPNADQNDPGWRDRGAGCCGGKVHPGALAFHAVTVHQ